MPEDLSIGDYVKEGVLKFNEKITRFRSEKIAKSAVNRFVVGDQVEIQKFTADSDSVIVLKNYYPGAIFRLYMENDNKVAHRYLWFVIGNSNSLGIPDVFEIIPGSAEYDPTNDKNLKLSRDWNLSPVQIRKKEFTAFEAKWALGWARDEATPDKDWAPSVEVDVMTTGTREKKRSSKLTGHSLTSLNPSLQPI
ncbi:hypothetical protein A2397_04865 [Candidatus Amesbacteria bacterium RIFOXYB1_FULL_44_23]|uniref:Uncharacterized protein n=1 Tax=Candidatus Amesbacteria bacterium RIFOXYB1_FULL_44_23 TaxID=1797263 RepID=A0A1F4ZVC8_9BACT|nr:MAG: hypothetical protein A2397_04865 [Candidatus Amesbacteria bacterium RIFOXYB1_FULL_44_23]